MESFNEQDWLTTLEDAALRATEARMEMNRAAGYDYSDETADQFYNAYLIELKNKVPFSSITSENDLDEIEKFKGDAVMRWVDRNYNGPSPKEVNKSIEASKFLPLLAGVAEEGQDWYSMGDLPLKEKALEMGYKVDSKEGFKEFLDKVAEYQRLYDLGQNTQELRDSPWFTVGSIIAPSATKAIEHSAATGEDLSPGTAAALTLLDQGVNTAMLAMPNLNVLKARPILNGVLDAGLQGTTELGRQLGAYGIDENVEIDPYAPMIATSLGATRPGLIGSAQMLTRNFTGKAANDFSRGIMKATKAGDPTWAERQALLDNLEGFNLKMKSGELKPLVDGSSKEILVNLADAKIFDELAKVPGIAKKVGVKPLPDGTYRAEEVLKYYDSTPMVGRRISADGVQKTTSNPGTLKKGEVFLDPETEQAYQQLFGNRYADELANSKWSKAGLATGKFLSDFGGSFEPTFKMNPYDIATGNLKDDKEAYKKESWYLKLNKEQRNIIDAAMKKKQEEQEQE